MLLLLGLGEATTLLTSLIIDSKKKKKAIIELAKKGYRFDRDSYDLYKLSKKQNSTKFKNIGKVILYLIPGVNIASSAIIGKKESDELLSNKTIKSQMVCMNKKEKVLYFAMPDNLKYKFATSLLEDYNNQNEVSNEQLIDSLLLQSDSTRLYYQKIMKKQYSYDEVLSLNETLGNEVRFGIMDGDYVAIIGIPESEKITVFVSMESENFRTMHEFTPITFEEAKDKKFDVYPYTLTEELERKINDSNNTELIKAIEGGTDNSQHLKTVDMALKSLTKGEEIQELTEQGENDIHKSIKKTIPFKSEI